MHYDIVTAEILTSMGWYYLVILLPVAFDLKNKKKSLGHFCKSIWHFVSIMLKIAKNSWMGMQDNRLNIF